MGYINYFVEHAGCHVVVVGDDDKIPEKDYNKLSQKEKDFVAVKRTIDDFKSGLVIPGKLLPVHIPGGVVLADVDYTLRE